MNADTRLRRAGGRHRVEAKRILSHLLNGSWEAAALSPAQLLRAQAHMRVQTKTTPFLSFPVCKKSVFLLPGSWPRTRVAATLEKALSEQTWPRHVTAGVFLALSHFFFFLNPTPFPCWERSPGVHTALAALAVAGSEAT